jgi:hypothetical protein
MQPQSGKGRAEPAAQLLPDGVGDRPDFDRIALYR